MSAASHSAKSASLSPKQLAALRGLDTCTVANAIEATGARLRNEGYMGSDIACLFPSLPPLVGYALPLQVHTSEPPIEGTAFVDRVDWWDQLLAVPEPRILVVEDMHSHPGTGSFLGEVHAHIYRALGCAGVITNGAVRDIPALKQMSFPVFAAYVSVSHAYAHVTGIGGPVKVGGLRVQTGDLMHGDCHGVLCIPIEVAREVPAIARRQKKQEQTIIEYCQSPGFDVDGLKQLLHTLPR